MTKQKILDYKNAQQTKPGINHLWSKSVHPNIFSICCNFWPSNIFKTITPQNPKYSSKCLSATDREFCNWKFNSKTSKLAKRSGDKVVAIISSSAYKHSVVTRFSVSYLFQCCQQLSTQNCHALVLASLFQPQGYQVPCAKLQKLLKPCDEILVRICCTHNKVTFVCKLQITQANVYLKLW